MKPKSASGVLLSFWPKEKVLGFFLVCVLTLFVALVSPAFVSADTAAELQQKIAERNAKIAELEKEIARYEDELATVGADKKTLEGEISRLDISRKKLSTDILLTENKIGAANLQLEELGGEISDKQEKIDTGKMTIGESLRTLNKIGDTTLVEHLFTANGLSEAWTEVDKLNQLEVALRDNIKNLEETKTALTIDYNAVQKKQAQLRALKRELTTQKTLLDQNRKEQATLLSQTKNKESAYQKLLSEKQQAKAAFEQELREFENALAYSLDPSKIPRPGSGVLGFPLDQNYMVRCKDRVLTYKNLYCITQYFGNTPFAQGGAYGGKGHNGIDFGAPAGTKVVASLSGVVLATGNTDAYPGCYSYGQWILVKHPNGLATLYAHLSHISVVKDDVVGGGQNIGYSG